MYTYKAIVVRVVDGDTVDLDIDLGFDVWLKNQRVRLYGIDTPEIRTRDLDEKEMGRLAMEFVEAMCPIGSEVLIQTTLSGSRGKYGRLLGTIFIDSGAGSVNKLLLDNHLAVPYDGTINREQLTQLHDRNREILLG
jgi:micrococcal nuclease